MGITSLCFGIMLTMLISDAWYHRSVSKISKNVSHAKCRVSCLNTERVHFENNQQNLSVYWTWVKQVFYASPRCKSYPRPVYQTQSPTGSPVGRDNRASRVTGNTSIGTSLSSHWYRNIGVLRPPPSGKRFLIISRDRPIQLRGP